MVLMTLFWLVPLAGYIGWTEYRIWTMRRAVSDLIEANGTQRAWNDEAMDKMNALAGFEMDRQMKERAVGEGAIVMRGRGGEARF